MNRALIFVIKSMKKLVKSQCYGVQMGIGNMLSNPSGLRPSGLQWLSRGHLWLPIPLVTFEDLTNDTFEGMKDGQLEE